MIPAAASPPTHFRSSRQEFAPGHLLEAKLIRAESTDCARCDGGGRGDHLAGVGELGPLAVIVEVVAVEAKDVDAGEDEETYRL